MLQIKKVSVSKLKKGRNMVFTRPTGTPLQEVAAVSAICPPRVLLRRMSSVFT